MIDPSIKSSAIKTMQEHYEMLDTLRGGTSHMRKAGERYLPRNPAESIDAYSRRLKKAVLVPIYERTLSGLVGKPFKEPITFADDVPEAIVEHLMDCDQEGSNFTVFMREVALEALDKGISYVLVDFPNVAGEAQTVADEQRLGVRPYTVHIKPGSVCQIHTMKVQGRSMLTMFAYYECVTESDGAFGEVTREYVRVLRPDRWERWVKSDKGEWSLESEGVNTLGRIPVVALYAKRTGLFMGCPPLLEVAHLNVAHWQSRSEQQNILHVARVPILTISGGDDEKDVTIGTSTVINLPFDAKMSYVEHSGKAIEAGDKDLKNIQEEANAAGADMNVVKPGRYTATQVSIEDDNNLSPLQAFALAIEDAGNNILQLFAEWMRLPDGGHCSVFRDFAGMSEDTVEWLKLLYEAGAIDAETLFLEAQRLGIIDESLAYEDIRSRQDTEGPNMITNNPASRAMLRVLGGKQ